MKIAVIDYGIGNVRSIMGALENQGASAILTNDKYQILESDGLVLPGVGAFSHGMDCLDRYGLIDVILECVSFEKPLMGICLGMQVLFEESEEFGRSAGLGLIPGSVTQIPAGGHRKLPHIGWQKLDHIDAEWSGTILEGVNDRDNMYFVHSFVANPSSSKTILSVTEYSDYIFCSSVKHGNIYGCQFHPEKSGQSGLKVISNFIEICSNEK